MGSRTLNEIRHVGLGVDCGVVEVGPRVIGGDPDVLRSSVHGLVDEARPRIVLLGMPADVVAHAFF